MAARTIGSIEELKGLVGQEVGVTDWFEVTQSRISSFAEATEDRQWIHIDAGRARTESPYKNTIAHGFLTLSLISHLAKQAVQIGGSFKMGINYGLNRVRFPAPVPSGSRIRGRYGLKSLEEIDGGVQITWDVTVEVEGAQKPSLVAEWLVRQYT
jgi:acyl dehydratase